MSTVYFSEEKMSGKRSSLGERCPCQHEQLKAEKEKNARLEATIRQLREENGKLIQEQRQQKGQSSRGTKRSAEAEGESREVRLRKVCVSN